MVLTKPSAISVALASALFALSHATLAENPTSPTGSGWTQLNGVWFATAPSENTFILKDLPSASRDITAYTFYSGQAALTDGVSIIENNQVTLTAENKNANILNFQFNSIKVYGGYAEPAASSPAPAGDTVTIRKNTVTVDRIMLIESPASKFIGGGEYFDSVDDIQRSRVVASGNKVVINDSSIDGKPIILGGGGRTAINNTVELKAAHISNFTGTILGGMGETATGNTLKISDDSSNFAPPSNETVEDWEQLGKVGGIS